MKTMDKLVDNIRFEKKYVFFSIIIVLIGIITGALFIVVLNQTDKNLVIEYIKDFINKIEHVNYFDYLKNICLSNYISLFIMIIIGFTYFFIPINIFLLFYKSFIIGFTISSFILTFNIKGLIYSFIYIFPHLMLNIFIFLLLTAFTLKLSIKMIKYIIKKKNVNMNAYFKKYISIIVVFSIFLLLSSLYEAYIVPKLFIIVLKYIK